jgi:4-azaleucine resistance transporter AzlC
MRAALPIVIGYFTVAMAFGAGCVPAGISPLQAVSMSVFIYQGAVQFILLAAVKAGTPLAYILVLCAMISTRHLLYGPLVAKLLPPGLKARLALAWGLTDEVFAVALADIHQRETAGETVTPDAPWFFGLALASYLSWIAGTAAGALLGVALADASPEADAALRFAFPALFLVLVVQNFNARNRLPVLTALVIAGVLGSAGFTAPAILGGALCGVVVAALSARRARP